MKIKQKSWLLSLVFHGALMLTVIVASFRIHSVLLKNPSVKSVSLVSRHPPDSQQHSLQWLSKRFNGQLVIDQKFQSVHGLTGYVVHLQSKPAQQSIVYADESRHFVLIGTLIDEKVGNVSLNDSAHYLQHNLESRLVRTIAPLHGILQGKNKRKVVTIIIDPNSHFFPIMYKNLETDVQNGEFSVRWLLINYLKPNGPNVALNILSSRHPKAALIINAEKYNKQTQTGGYLKTASRSPHAMMQLQHRWGILTSLGLSHFPISFFHDAHHHLHVITGLVTDEYFESVL